MNKQKNKLYGCRAYLCGAMDRVADHGAGWRDSITKDLHKLGVIVFNPLKKPLHIDSAIENDNNRNIRNKWKQDGDYDKFNTVKSIRTTDLRMVDISDFLVVNINIDIHACGTYEEIVTANRQKKPILIHVEQGKEHCPDWLLFMIPHEHIFGDWSDLVDNLKKTNSGDYNHNRWVFFDLKTEMDNIKSVI